MAAVQVKKVKNFTPILATFAQLATNQILADDGLLDRVKELLRKLASDLEENYRQDAEDEQAAIEQYNNTKERLANLLASLEG